MLCVSWVAIVFSAYRPGVLFFDTVAHYSMGLTRHYGNWHPPLTQILIGEVGRLAGSPWPVYLLQLSALGGAMLAVVWAPGSRPWAGSLLYALFLLTPSVWGTAITLWKDVWMGAALLIAVAFLRWCRPMASAFALVVAVLFRHNAIFAVIPLAYVAAAQFRPSWSRARIAFVTGALVLAAFFAPKTLEVSVRAADEWPLGSVLVYDLAGIYVRAPEHFAGSIIERELTLEQLRAVYFVDTAAHLWWDVNPHMDYSRLAANRREISREWARMVRRAPGAYLAHRWDVVTTQLGLRTDFLYMPFFDQMVENPWGLTLSTGGASYTFLDRTLRATRNSVFFRAWFWVAASLALTVVGYRMHRTAPLAFAVALSSVLYFSAYLVISIAADFRYSYWNVLAVFAAGVLLASPTARVRSGGGRT